MSDLPVDLLETFDGYLALGMFMEAHEELERFPNELKTHPAVLTARLALLVEMKHWENGVILGRSLIRLWPQCWEFHEKTAYCLHELKRTGEAKQTLLEGPKALRGQAIYHYNIACYEAQLGNLIAAREHLGDAQKACLRRRS